MRQDGNLNFVALPGFVLKNSVTNDSFLVLSNQTWAVLVWPVQVIEPAEYGLRFGHITLVSGSDGVQWRFIYNPNDYEVIPFTAAWDYDRGVHMKVNGASQPLIQMMILTRSSSFVFHHLRNLGSYMNVPASETKSRLALLTAIANLLGSDEYVSAVLENDGKKSTDISDESAELIECLLENMDLNERRDFGFLREKTENRESVKKSKRWMSWYKEKLDEVEVSWMSHTLDYDWCFLFIVYYLQLNTFEYFDLNLSEIHF